MTTQHAGVKTMEFGNWRAGETNLLKFFRDGIGGGARFSITYQFLFAFLRGKTFVGPKICIKKQTFVLHLPFFFLKKTDTHTNDSLNKRV